jgi:hypothetical protein
MNSNNRPEPMRPSEIMPMGWEPAEERAYARFIGKFLLPPLAVLLLIMLSGCSKAVSITPMPPPPANLESNCRPLDDVPDPLIDPERALWESHLIALYTECSVKHRLTVEAWLAAIDRTK